MSDKEIMLRWECHILCYDSVHIRMLFLSPINTFSHHFTSSLMSAWTLHAPRQSLRYEYIHQYLQNIPCFLWSPLWAPNVGLSLSLMKLVKEIPLGQIVWESNYKLGTPPEDHPILPTPPPHPATTRTSAQASDIPPSCPRWKDAPIAIAVY